MAGRIKRLKVSEVRVVPGVQQRADGCDGEHVNELAQWLKDHPKDDLPPVVVFHANGIYRLGGGHHTLPAYERAGRTDLPCEVREGTERDALRFALSDNAAHGKRRTAADKRTAVTTALKDPEWSKLPDRKVAELCGLSPDDSGSWVGRVRRELNVAHPAPAHGARIKESMAKAAGGGADRLHHPAPEPPPPPSDSGPFTTPKPVALPRDRLGRVLPQHLVPVFEAGAGLLAAVRLIRSAKAKAEHAARTDLLGDVLKRHPGVRVALDEADCGLAASAPFAVCPLWESDAETCRQDCPTCRGNGWVGYAEYQRLPAPLKERAESFRPGDAWEGDQEPVPSTLPPPAFVPAGPGADGLGERIPKALRDVFADESLAAAGSALRRIARQLKAASAWAVHLKPVWVELEKAAAEVEGSRPFAVCGRCRGDGCDSCLSGGWYPLWMRHELKGVGDAA